MSRKVVKMTNTRKCLSISCCAVAVFLSATAASDQPSKGTDLALPGSWKSGTLPGTGDEVNIYENKTYTASEDVTFGNMFVRASATFDFTAKPGRTIKFTKSESGTYFNMQMQYPSGTATDKEMDVYFKGGIWEDNSSGKGFVVSRAQSNHSAYLSQGCVWTNLAEVNVGYSGSDNFLSLAGASRIHADQLTLSNGKPLHGNRLEVTGESSIRLAKSLYTDLGASGTASEGTNVLTVCGNGSSIISDSETSCWGNKSPHNVMTVTDGASVSFPGFTIGNEKTSVDNSVFVGNGATFTTGAFVLRGSGSEMVISNATFAFTSDKNSDFAIGAAGPNFKDCTFRVEGPQSSMFAFPQNQFDVFAAGATEDRFELLNGAKWPIAQDYPIFAHYTTNCTVRIASGAEVKISGNGVGLGTLVFGGERTPRAAVSNALEIADGATVECGQLRFGGCHNRCVIDDGLLVVTNTTDYSVRIGFRHDSTAKGEYPTNCCLVLRGSHPQLKATNRLAILYQSALRFEIPQDGYEQVPVEAHDLYFADENCRLEIEFEGSPDKLPRLVPLVRADGLTSTTCQKVFAATNARLPAKYSLKVVDGVLCLKTPNAGMMIIFR